MATKSAQDIWLNMAQHGATRMACAHPELTMEAAVSLGMDIADVFIKKLGERNAFNTLNCYTSGIKKCD